MAELSEGLTSPFSLTLACAVDWQLILGLVILLHGNDTIALQEGVNEMTSIVHILKGLGL